MTAPASAASARSSAARPRRARWSRRIATHCAAAAGDQRRDAPHRPRARAADAARRGARACTRIASASWVGTLEHRAGRVPRGSRLVDLATVGAYRARAGRRLGRDPRVRAGDRRARRRGAEPAAVRSCAEGQPVTRGRVAAGSRCPTTRRRATSAPRRASTWRASTRAGCGIAFASAGPARR